MEWGALSGGLTTPAAWQAAPGDGSLLRLVTALFLHADWAHLLGNLVFLLIFGLPSPGAACQATGVVSPPDNAPHSMTHLDCSAAGAQASQVKLPQRAAKSSGVAHRRGGFWRDGMDRNKAGPRFRRIVSAGLIGTL